MKTYNFNVRTLHALCFVLAWGLLVAGLQSIFVANAGIPAGAPSVLPGHAIGKMVCGFVLLACAWFDALENQLPDASCRNTATYSSSETKAAAKRSVDQAFELVKMSHSKDMAKSVTSKETPLTGSGASCTSSALHGLAENHRARLEELAMHALANAAIPCEQRFSPKEAGARLREAIDALVTPSATAASDCTSSAYRAMQTAITKTATAQRLASVNGHTTEIPAATSAEAMIQAKGKSATHITHADIEASIAAEYSFTLDKALTGCHLAEGLDRVTLSVIVLRNGTKLVGVNYGAIDPARHDPKMGHKEARSAAIEQIWPLLGYELRSQIASQSA